MGASTLHNEKEQHAGLHHVYYEIIKDGYNPLHVNQLSPQKIIVKNGDSKQELMQELQNSIDLNFIL
ncbi:hypothetical protein [Bacillus sp. IBL03825]|uniref:hypothetical protein n=1 Tax=Bacillus sp. IBL03825 TaxID=2953580 RepID=UPI00215874D8|nr:hypothetical protein [Bacillus sp. IBL03825]MCR6850477.1 hypothetical protein [Bacillus sp. IBL03825]